MCKKNMMNSDDYLSEVVNATLEERYKNKRVSWPCIYLRERPHVDKTGWREI